MSDDIEIAKIKNWEVYLVAWKHGFGKNFILWVKTLLRDQESCVISGRAITKYFSLGDRQGDLISAFFIYFSFRDLASSYKIET